MSERFTFIICGHESYHVEERFCNRREADRYFDMLLAAAIEDNLSSVTYYNAEVGGLVNAWYQS
jgi:hypothetical protein